MIELMIAAALAQGSAPGADRCNAIAAGAPPAGCPQWRLVHHSEEGDGFVDPGSVRRDGQQVEIMLRTIFTQPIAGGARSLNARVRLDCAGRTKTIVHMSAWDAEGGRLFDQPITTDQASRPQAGTPYARVMDEFCGAATGA